MKRKIGLILLASMLLLSTGLLFACSAKVKIEIDSELTMSVYETKVLEPKVSGYEGELGYSSSDPTVVAVEKAKITAYKKGTAIITITAGDKASAEINVTVEESTVSPAISVPMQDVRVVIGEKFEFAPTVKLGDKTVDAQLNFEVKNKEIASYENGAISAKKIGQTELVVSGKYMNTNLRPITVKITVIDDLLVQQNKKELNLYTYSPEGSKDYPTEDTVVITVEEKGHVVENPVIEWSIDDEKVATVSNGVVKAVGEGTATVKAVYKDVTMNVAVTVSKTMLNSGTVLKEYDLNAANADKDYIEFEFKAEEIALSEITAVKDVTDKDAKVVEFETGSGKLLLKKSTVTCGERIITLENDKFGVKIEALFATKIIYNKADMIASMALATEGYEEYPGVSPAPKSGDPKFYVGADGYFVLADDVDMQGDIFRLTYLDNTNYPGFTGTFDGRGHTVYNVGGSNNGNCRSGMFGLVKKGGVIKNVAFVNCWGANYRTDGGTRQEGKHNVVVGCLSGGTIENVYLYAVRDDKMTQPWGNGALVGQYVSGTINNVFVAVKDITRNVVADGTNGPGTIIGQFIGNGGVEAVRSVTNTYGINDLYKAVGVGTSLDDAATVARWKTYSELFEAVQAEDFSRDFSSFANSELWSVVDGVPVFKSVLELMKGEKLALNGSAVAEAGKKTELSTNSAFASMIEYRLKNEVAGITLTNGTLNVGADVANNTKFTVVAYNLFNKTAAAEREMSVANIAVLAHTDFDLSSAQEQYAIALGGEITPTKVSVESGATLSPENYSVSGTNLMIKKAGVQEILGAKKYGDFSLLIETSGARSYRVDVSVVTKILRTKDDAKEMMKLATAGFNVVTQNTVEGQPSFYNGADGYFILAEDIDMGGDILRFTLRAASGGTPGFMGILDGRGHKISNIGSDKYVKQDGSTGYLGNNHAGIFGNITGTVKNIAFVNIYAGMDTVSGIKTPYDTEARSVALAWMVGGNGVVDNVYLSYYANDVVATGNGAIPGCDTKTATIRNFVVERFDVEGAKQNAVNDSVVGYYWSAKVSNTFGIYGKYTGKGMNGNVNQWTPGYSTLFSSYEAMKEAKVDLSGFSAEYWDVSQGYPVFKSCMNQQ